MKLIIEINEEKYNQIINSYQGSNVRPKDYEIAVINGTPIPDNATNGDILWAMFPTIKIDEMTHKIYATIQYDWTYVGIEFDAMKEWWNAPYQKGGTNRKNCEYRHENGNCLKVGGFCTSVDNEHCVKGGK